MPIRSVALALALLAAGAPMATAQEDLANRVQVNQRGGPHRAAAAQRGVADLIAIAQQGRGHNAAIAQNGDRNTATIRQFGRDNTASITQSGSNNASCVIQVGRGVSTEVVQTGGQSAGLIQTPRGTREVPVEICAGARLGRGGVLLGVGGVQGNSHYRSVRRR